MTPNRRSFVRSLGAPLLGLLLSACGGADLAEPAENVATEDQWLTNGTLVTDLQNPGAVAVYHQYIRPCTGTLIRMAWVLTARHCLTTDGSIFGPLMDPAGVSVTRMSNPGLTPPPGVSVGVQIVAPATADFAMVRIFPEMPGPAGFWNGDAAALQGLQVQAFGYGRSVAGGNTNVEDGTSGAGTLRQATFTVSSVAIPNTFEVQNGMGQIMNHGDSGGPSFRLWDTFGRPLPGVAGVHQFPSTDWLVPTNRATIRKRIYAPGDHDREGRADLFLTGGVNWSTIPVARSNAAGGFTVTNLSAATFASLAQTAGAKPVAGDFNGDGRADMALTGAPSWTKIPIAQTNGVGTFTVVQNTLANFPGWAATAGAKALAGDFNGDGRGDIALTGASGWGTVPVAFSNGNGTFWVTNHGVANFPVWAAGFNVTPVSGDFDGDGRDDLALTGGSGWGTIPVAFSDGGGTFTVTNAGVASFPTWAATPGAKPVAGDFNGDGRDDIALVGVGTWTTIPVAYALGNGGFSVVTHSVTNFPAWSATAGVKALTGDFNGDVYDDIALTGGSGWGTIPLAYGLGGSGFSISNPGVANFPIYAAQSGAKPVSGH